jgi:N-methylhydantoinase A/oxoprolinase/acetone carboxylase beta subunit
MGMLVSEPGRELSRPVLKPLADLMDEEIGDGFSLLETDAQNQLTQEGCDPASITFRHQLELRYKGQSATISINWSSGGAHETLFQEAHKKASGLQLPHPIELVNLRLSARAPAALISIDIREENRDYGAGGKIYMPELDDMVPIHQRAWLPPGESLAGPLLLAESAATSWIKPGWMVRADEWGNLLLHTRK